MERNNYEQMTVPELKNLARERGLTRYSRLRKSELIRRLREQPILEWGNDATMTNFHRKKRFTQDLREKVLVMKIMNMQKRYGRCLV